MVWAGISSVSRTPLVFIPAGDKINAAMYKELILQPIVKDLGEMMFENQPFMFQQDGAPAHTAKSTQKWLQTNIPDFISKEVWAISQCGPFLSSSACSKSHNNIESLKQSLTREWAKIPHEMLCIAAWAVPERLKAVIRKKGGYIDRIEIMHNKTNIKYQLDSINIGLVLYNSFSVCQNLLATLFT